MWILPDFHAGLSRRAVARPFWRKLQEAFPQLPKRVEWQYSWSGDPCMTSEDAGEVAIPFVDPEPVTWRCVREKTLSHLLMPVG